MEALGQKLKQTRIERGIKLVEVQEQTKIRARYLEAIEEGKWELLPGHVYAKGFIRSYAEYLGLDGQALLDEYGLSFQPQDIAEADPTEHTVQKSRSSKPASVLKQTENSVERVMWPQFAIGAGILVILIVGYVYFSNRGTSSHQDAASNSQHHSNQTTTTNKNQSQAKTQPTPQVQTPAPPPKPAVMVTPLQNTSDSSSYSVSNADSVSLQLSTPNGICWVNVTSDGKNIYSGTLEQGVTQSWSAGKKLEIVAGNSAAIALEVNGQNVAALDFKGRHMYSFQLQ